MEMLRVCSGSEVQLLSKRRLSHQAEWEESKEGFFTRQQEQPEQNDVPTRKK